MAEKRTITAGRPDGAAWRLCTWIPRGGGDGAAARREIADVGETESAKTRFVLIAPTASALLRVLVLPTRDPGELRDMAELQLGRISPFAMEDLTISHEVLAEEEAHSRILLAAVPTERLDALAAPLRARGVRPERVDLAALGRLRALAAAEPPAAAERVTFLFLNDASIECIVLQHGQPVLFREFGFHGSPGDANFADELADELVYTLTVIDADWGPVATQRAILASPEEREGRALAAALRTRRGPPVEWRDAGSLMSPEEGAARRLEESPEGLDLTPVAWRHEEERRRFRKRLMTAAAGFLAVWGVAAIALFGFLRWETAHLARMERRAAELEAPTAAIRAVQKRVRALEQYADRSHSALECLREVSALLPDGVDLMSFNYRKGESINLRGEADSAQTTPILDFLAALEGSGVFEDVRDQQVQTRSARGRRLAEFRVTLGLPGEAAP
jgi:Tfp pilus assembly protein PilN